MTDQYKAFRDLVEDQYRYCTLTEQLGVYVQHRPGSVVPFLEQLIRELHPEDCQEAEQHEQDPGTD